MASKSKYTPVIVVVSILIPLTVGLLYIMPKETSTHESLFLLPKLNAFINGTTFFVLIAAFVAIRKRNIKWHKRLMLTAFTLSCLFFISYLIYHSSAPSTHFGGEGIAKTIYFSLLISHIILAAIIVPLVLITLIHAISERFDKHKKIARITLPIWLYVTLTGVIVYLMISPYY